MRAHTHTQSVARCRAPLPATAVAAVARRCGPRTVVATRASPSPVDYDDDDACFEDAGAQAQGRAHGSGVSERRRALEALRAVGVNDLTNALKRFARSEVAFVKRASEELRAAVEGCGQRAAHQGPGGDGEGYDSDDGDDAPLVTPVVEGQEHEASP